MKQHIFYSQGGPFGPEPMTFFDIPPEFVYLVFVNRHSGLVYVCSILLLLNLLFIRIFEVSA